VREILARYAGQADVTEEEVRTCLSDVRAWSGKGNLFSEERFER
jgi:hypothetical protein